MTDSVSELAKRLAIGRKGDGRTVYDEAAKAELVSLCLQPGASVSRLARECGINANQVWRWMREHARRSPGGALAMAAPRAGAFVEMPLVVTPPPPASGAAVTLHLHAQLPNGVSLELPGLDLQQLADVVVTLGRVRCSASTKA